jgi:hypothetical protein
LNGNNEHTGRKGRVVLRTVLPYSAGRIFGHMDVLSGREDQARLLWEISVRSGKNTVFGPFLE